MTVFNYAAAFQLSDVNQHIINTVVWLHFLETQFTAFPQRFICGYMYCKFRKRKGAIFLRIEYFFNSCCGVSHVVVKLWPLMGPR